MSENDKDDALLAERIAGHNARDIAKRYKCTPADVDRAVDALPEITNEYRMRSLKICCEQLDQLLIPFWDKAVHNKDVASAILVEKIIARKADLLGICPVRIDPVALAVAARPSVSGTDRVLQALADLSARSNGSNGPPQ
jgi:hypothetical protein